MSCAAGYNIRWLLRVIASKAAKDAKTFLLALHRLSSWTQLKATHAWLGMQKTCCVGQSRLRPSECLWAEMNFAGLTNYKWPVGKAIRIGLKELGSLRGQLMNFEMLGRVVKAWQGEEF